MSLLKRFRFKKPSTANLAKERLQIIVSHERKDRDKPDFLPDLQKELVEVIAKYIKIDADQVKVDLEKMGDCSVLELNITLPDLAEAEASA